MEDKKIKKEKERKEKEFALFKYYDCDVVNVCGVTTCSINLVLWEMVKINSDTSIKRYDCGCRDCR